MRTFFWISLFLPLAVLAEDIDFFNESSTQMDAPKDMAPPAPMTKGEHKGWGQGMLQSIEKLTGQLFHRPSPIPLKHPSQQLSPEYLRKQLKTKEQEIMYVRQQILQTTDGQKIQTLTGILQRLEGERHSLLEGLKPTPTAPSTMAVPTPPVEKIALPEAPSFPTNLSEEDALKAQLDRLTQEEAVLSAQIKTTADANALSTLGSQLERTQQNKSLVILSLKDVQRHNLKNSTVGFGATLLPPPGMDMTTPIPPLTPSLEQVAPSSLSTPWSGGWGGLLPAPAKPVPKNKNITPMDTPVTGDGWKQVQSEASTNFEKKNTHTTYGTAHKPLWISKDHLVPNRKSVVPHAPVDHRHIVEKIRKEKILRP
jgi:hypothetical protein